MKSGTLNNAREAEMDIVMTGRHVDVPAHYRVHVTDKLTHLERYNSHVIRYDVELAHERNPRQSKACQRVEITGTGKGSTVRAEACGPDFYTALDAAVGKLEARLRRSHDRRRVHHGRHQHTTTNPLEHPSHEHPSHEHPWESTDVEGAGHIVREKEHSGEPMTVDQALSEMELVGHDFYLFADAASARPSVVYRRKGFDYGVIRLV
jgi:ribosomal subunit interface protein